MVNVGEVGPNAEWYRSDHHHLKGEMLEVAMMNMIVMDVLEVPNFDGRGKFLYMLQPHGEVTKVSAS